MISDIYPHKNGSLSIISCVYKEHLVSKRQNLVKIGIIKIIANSDKGMKNKVSCIGHCSKMKLSSVCRKPVDHWVKIIYSMLWPIIDPLENPCHICSIVVIYEYISSVIRGNNKFVWVQEESSHHRLSPSRTYAICKYAEGWSDVNEIETASGEC